MISLRHYRSIISYVPYSLVLLFFQLIFHLSTIFSFCHPSRLLPSSLMNAFPTGIRKIPFLKKKTWVIMKFCTSLSERKVVPQFLQSHRKLSKENEQKTLLKSDSLLFIRISFISNARNTPRKKKIRVRMLLVVLQISRCRGHHKVFFFFEKKM